MIDPDLLKIGGIVFTSVSATGWLTWFISDQLRKNRDLFYRVISLHNREDDDRFAALQDDLWDIKLRNSARDGKPPPQRKAFPRRRYLAEALEEQQP